MKEKALTFIIGFLVGAIVATGGFFIYDKVRNNNTENIPNNNPQQMMQNGEMMPGGFKGGFTGPKGDMTPPDMQMQDENEQNNEQQNNMNNQTTKNSNVKQGGKMKGNFNGAQNDGSTPPEISNSNQTTT